MHPLNSSPRDWTWLPSELLNLIREKLDKFSDYMRFNAICPHWRYIALKYIHHDHVHVQKLGILKTCHNKLPMLMIQAKSNCEESRSFYSIIDEKIYELQLPMPYNRRCLGSSYGWLFTIEKSMTISLLNPFLDRIISLPTFCDPSNNEDFVDDDYEYFIAKGILLSDPCLNPYNYGVGLIYGGMKRLVFFQSSDKAWTFVDAKEDYVFQDVIYYKEKIFAVNNWGKLVFFNLRDGTTNVEINGKTSICSGTTYLVESIKGNLLMIRRSMDPVDEENLHYKTSGFEVYKWSHSKKHGESIWGKMKSLGTQALFLGDNHSMSISTLNFPGCRRNCIYYTHDYYNFLGKYVPFGSDEDIGFFNLKGWKLWYTLHTRSS